MSIQRRNYITHAIDDVRTMVRSGDLDPIAKDYAVDLLGHLDRAVKFQMPENGEMLVDIRDASKDVLDCVRLPFPTVAAEYDITLPSAAPKAITVAVDLDAMPAFKDALRELYPEDGGAWVSSLAFDPDRRAWVPTFAHILFPYRQAEAAVEKGFCRLGGIVLEPPVGSPEKVIARYGGFEGYSRQMMAEHFVDLTAIANLSLCSLCSNVEQTKVPAPKFLSRQRVKKGKAPFYEYRVLTVAPSVAAPSIGAGMARTGPRVHLRRGHIRRLSDGRMTWVRHCVVGDKAKGVVMKDYRLMSGGAQQ